MVTCSRSRLLAFAHLLACPLCGGEGWEIAEQGREEGELFCLQCGSVFECQEGILSLLPPDSPAAQEGEFWGGLHRRLWEHGVWTYTDLARPLHPLPHYGARRSLDRETRARWGTRLPAGRTPVPREAILPFLPPAPARDAWAVDLGCGSGWLTLELARRGWRVLGIDIAGESLRLARQVAAGRYGQVLYAQADLLTLRLRAQRFAGLFASQSLHHLPQLAARFDCWLAALQPRAWVVYDEHRAHPAPGRILARRLRRWGIEHLRRHDAFDPALFAIYRSFEQRGSVHEDAGLREIDCLPKRLRAVRQLRSHRLLDEIALLRWSASGKESDFWRVCRPMLRLERLLAGVGAQQAEFVVVQGRRPEEL